MNPQFFKQSIDADISNAKTISKLLMTQTTHISETYGELWRKSMAEWMTALPHAMTAHAAVSAWEGYTTDAWQRAAIFLDVLRQRGNLFKQHEASGMPPVLGFEFEVILDGRSLGRPVNYSLLMIKPPAGVTINPARRPFMIVDPRAGHGAGIGGFKPESQVGEAFEDGHAVYFVVFRPWPEPGQTLSDVRDAEKAFLEEIHRRHPDAAKPVLIGNCQGGWGCMMLAASAPDLAGPLAINGAPMSYWAGETGRNPMRYTGGLIGGVAPVMYLADLGNGVFDGSLLVQNFETLNPANTYWKKLYNVYAHVDTEAERFLDFERWWGGFFMMNEEEIRWIVENLFIGNRLAHGQAMLGKERVDLKNIRSPIVVFASHGDNITPPQQALNWIADTYRDVNEIKARGQRIVYLLHDSIGHLGIFVSAKIADREHDAITDTMRAIEALPPGLYEMELEQAEDRVHIKFVPRTINDILSLDDGRKDEEMFAAVAKLSELNANAYATLVRPFVRAIVDDKAAKQFFRTRPLRVERAAFSDDNPMMGPVKALADQARATRKIVDPNNPFLIYEKLVSNHIEQSWNLFRDVRDMMREAAFHAIYGSPLMRMIGAQEITSREQTSAENLLMLSDVRNALNNIERGGEAEGAIRMLELLSNARGYVRRSRLERELELFKTVEPFASMTDAERATMIHEQSLIVQFAPDKALASLPGLLDTAQERAAALDLVTRIAGPEQSMHPDALALYRRFETLLGHASAPESEPAQLRA